MNNIQTKTIQYSEIQKVITSNLIVYDGLVWEIEGKLKPLNKSKTVVIKQPLPLGALQEVFNKYLKSLKYPTLK